MNIFFYQALVKLSETYEKATGNKNIGRLLKKFAEEFADQLSSQKDEKKD